MDIVITRIEPMQHLAKKALCLLKDDMLRDMLAIKDIVDSITPADFNGIYLVKVKVRNRFFYMAPGKIPLIFLI